MVMCGGGQGSGQDESCWSMGRVEDGWLSEVAEWAEGKNQEQD